MLLLAQVNYVIHGLVKRLEEHQKQWLVTLKTLIVFHRLMRETDMSFQVGGCRALAPQQPAYTHGHTHTHMRTHTCMRVCVSAA